MAKPFNGVINIDIRDSVPDWEPYTQPIAPEGAPNVLYIVLDDVADPAGAIAHHGQCREAELPTTFDDLRRAIDRHELLDELIG